MNSTLSILSSPQVKDHSSVQQIMHNVLFALAPAALFAVFAFGLSALITLVTSTGVCVLAEHWACRWKRTPSTIADGSALITGLLYGMSLPPGLPLWMVVVGALVATWIGKQLFGGLGANCFNPALVGRAFLQAAFPTAMTTWSPAFLSNRFSSLLPSTLTPPFSRPPELVDALSAATPLSAWKFGGMDTDSDILLVGMTSGSIGETSAVLLLAGGLWLSARHMMNWRISAAMLFVIAVLSQALHLWDASSYPDFSFMLFSGGAMLGALFMATDMVASPMSHRGCVIYGALIGALVVLIRCFGGMPEGVMYAILLGNAASPHIDRLTQPRVFGTGQRVN